MKLQKISYSIVIPTFKERDNLKDLIPSINRALGVDAYRTEVIVVDDNSRDGTSELCFSLAHTLAIRLRLITRKQERGLATAVIQGLKASRGDHCLVMDADFSHPPGLIRDLFREITAGGADFAIASRYVSGASIAGDWGIARWLNSKFATLLARPLTSVQDPLSGFFAFPRRLIANWDNLDPVGYKIGLEILVKSEATNVSELPIHFANRKHGDSKLSARQQLDYLRHLSRLYAYRFSRLKALRSIGRGRTVPVNPVVPAVRADRRATGDQRRAA